MSSMFVAAVLGVIGSIAAILTYWTLSDPQTRSMAKRGGGLPGYFGN